VIGTSGSGGLTLQGLSEQISIQGDTLAALNVTLNENKEGDDDTLLAIQDLQADLLVLGGLHCFFYLNADAYFLFLLLS
jgi:hypothetical protein